MNEKNEQGVNNAAHSNIEESSAPASIGDKCEGDIAESRAYVDSEVKDGSGYAALGGRVVV